MFGNNEFDKYLHAVMERGGYEARQDGSATIEAQHLLLAIAAQDGTAPQRLLAEAGLDAQAIRDALDREFEQSLAIAGVSITNLPEPSRYSTKAPSVGATGKLALERMTTTYPKRELRQANLLLGILQAEVGTVPRALTLAGANRVALVNQVHELLTD
ncbi:Clp protease N-terminal domain-containing protein [Nocardia sp. XZ_19_385]|uniref:Clp protease N-terminal domain-containing protein n=1 Tax=Nocardia sp. XZ_19_385 TaxID=2769488 RepID=UPI001890200E|nr:Clp protease N-terminal domain-containing protein [Nocardia sp. XZ_19_385]